MLLDVVTGVLATVSCGSLVAKKSLRQGCLFDGISGVRSFYRGQKESCTSIAEGVSYNVYFLVYHAFNMHICGHLHICLTCSTCTTARA